MQDSTPRNTWQKGFTVRKVMGVPDSYVVEVDGCRYHNKCDLTLRHPDDDGESDSHSNTHDVPMAARLIPTLHPRPQLKVP